MRHLEPLFECLWFRVPLLLQGLEARGLVNQGAIPPRARGLESAEKLARFSSVSHRLGMEHDCEVCASLPRAISPARTMAEIQLDERAVVLCRGHARIAANSGVTDFEGLRALYGSGRRSHVPRRDPLAAKAGEKRASLGRRVTDHA